jgi:Aromatic-ring-opening dioxygenase LigAB, LigA subunit
MSLYAVSRLMFDVTRDRDLAAQFEVAPATVLDGRDLSEAERTALASADLRALFELGTHPFVLYHFALRLAGGFSMPFMQQYLTQLQGLTVGDLET